MNWRFTETNPQGTGSAINYKTSSPKGISNNAAEEPPFYSWTYAITSRRANRHGVIHHAPPHRRLPCVVHARAGGHERIYRHQQRRARAGLLWYGRDGRLSFEPDFSGRQSAGVDRRQIWRTLARSGQGFRMQRRSHQRALWRHFFAGPDSSEAISRYPRRLRASNRELNGGAARRQRHRQADTR